MTFGRPYSIPIDYLRLELPLDIDLETIDAQDHPGTARSPNVTSTVAVYIETM